MDVLEQYQQRLEAHFTALAAAKQAGGHPVFGLEHCLTPEETDSLPALLGQALRCDGMLDRHWLCWITHAVEIGYDFEGLEYWQTFAEQTPNWYRAGNRDTLRFWFAQFASNFRGVRPIGRWGTHYTYIAWPITNALLPYDLQVQLARAIYVGRYRLKEIVLLPPESVGKFIARQAENPTARFVHFLEQRDLVGRVVKALLEGEPDETVIHRETLNRITRDLNQRSTAREWLKDARTHYAKFVGQIAGVRTPPRTEAANDEDTRTRADLDAQGVTVEPTIELRRHTPMQWRAYLLVPPFQSLVNARPEFRDHLAKARYQIPAHGDALFLGLSLLSGQPMPQLLRSWPDERRPLLQFNVANAYFDTIVKAECQITESEPWVFRCRDDGSAVYIAGKSIRAGEEYLLVGRNGIPLQSIGEPADISCEGVTARLLKMDPIAPRGLSDQLARVGISVRGKLVVRPVGLHPRQWNDDGEAVWVERERPCLAVERDHQFDTLTVTVDGHTFAPLDWSDGAATQLIALDNLAVGAHAVSLSALITTEDAFGTHRKQVAHTELEVYIRCPSTWTPGAQANAAMIVDTSPGVPSMEDFLRGSLQLRAVGDASRTVTCILELPGEEGRSEKLIEHRLPLTEKAWQEALEKFLKKTDLPLISAQNAYIALRAEDLGEVRVNLPHDPQPVRWWHRADRTSVKLKLINDGVEDELTVRWSPFEHPLSKGSLQIHKLAEGLDVTQSLGLYVAEYDGAQVSIVVAGTGAGMGLAGLSAHVDTKELRAYNDLAQLGQALSDWHSATPANYLAQIRRDDVTREIQKQIHRLVCGTSWVQTEDAVIGSPTEQNWARLEGHVDRFPSFAICLSNAWQKRSTDSLDLFASFAKAARDYKLVSRPEDAERAWLMATDPVALLNPKGSSPVGVSVDPTLVKGARLLHLRKELDKK